MELKTVRQKLQRNSSQENFHENSSESQENNTMKLTILQLEKVLLLSLTLLDFFWLFLTFFLIFDF
jgi:hypothetical protein